MDQLEFLKTQLHLDIGRTQRQEYLKDPVVAIRQSRLFQKRIGFIGSMRGKRIPKSVAEGGSDDIRGISAEIDGGPSSQRNRRDIIVVLVRSLKAQTR